MKEFKQGRRIKNKSLTLWRKVWGGRATIYDGGGGGWLRKGVMGKRYHKRKT